MLHIWHEDSTNSSTSTFWNFIKSHGIDSKLHGADIQGFNSNSNLYNYLKTASFKQQDTYIVLIDCVLDNTQALKYYIKAQNIVSGYSNVILVDLLCFEYMVLKFKWFTCWTEPITGGNQYKQLKVVREDFIKCMESGDSWINYNSIVHFIIKCKNINTSIPNWMNELSHISSENVATLILSCMVNGGKTDFGVSKTRLGTCWTCNCCNRHNKNIDKTCKLYRYNKNSYTKAKNLYNGTMIKSILSNV